MLDLVGRLWLAGSGWLALVAGSWSLSLAGPGWLAGEPDGGLFKNTFFP